MSCQRVFFLVYLLAVILYRFTEIVCRERREGERKCVVDKKERRGVSEKEEERRREKGNNVESVMKRESESFVCTVGYITS